MNIRRHYSFGTMNKWLFICVFMTVVTFCFYVNPVGKPHFFCGIKTLLKLLFLIFLEIISLNGSHESHCSSRDIYPRVAFISRLTYTQCQRIWWMLRYNVYLDGDKKPVDMYFNFWRKYRFFKRAYIWRFEEPLVLKMH